MDNMIKPYDMFENEIKVGDFIVYSTVSNQSANTRFARVLNISINQKRNIVHYNYRTKTRTKKPALKVQIQQYKMVNNILQTERKTSIDQDKTKNSAICLSSFDGETLRKLIKLSEIK